MPGPAQSSRLLLMIVFCCGMVWGQVDLDRMHKLALSRYGQETAEFVGEWRTMLDGLSAVPDEQKLVLINDFFNTRIRWMEDSEIWGKKDYWATPLDTMSKGKGDCEDFAIAKYVSLVLAGVDVQKLRITYVKAQVGGPQGKSQIAHMVLAYYSEPSADPNILDNMITSIRPASRRGDLTPVFGFNSQGLWVGSGTTSATRDPGSKLSRWRDLLQRAASEGLG